MRLRRPNVKAALPALSVIFVVAAAAVVWHNLPTPTDLYGPFDVHAEAGSPAVGRAVTATVTAVRIAPQVNSVQPAGVWVVVDTTLEANRSTGLPHSELIVGPNTYTPTDRFCRNPQGRDLSWHSATRLVGVRRRPRTPRARRV